MDGFTIIAFIFMMISVIVVGIKCVKASILCTHKILGTIESIRVDHDEDSVSYYAKCSYTYRGRPYISEEVSVGGRDKEGDQIYIYINPYKPRQAVKSREASFAGGVILIVIGIGIGAVAIPQMINSTSDILGERKEKELEAIREEAREKETIRLRQERLSSQRNQSDVNILLSGKKREYEEDEYEVVGLFGNIYIHCPPYVSLETYDEGNVNSGKATLYHKGTGNIYMRVLNSYNKNNVEHGTIYLRKWIRKNVKNAKLVKRYKIRGEIAEIYSVCISNNKGKKKYRHYAIVTDKRDMFIFIFNGDLNEFAGIIKGISL